MRILLCKIGIHDWKITKWSKFRQKHSKDPYEQGFDRECEYCKKRQQLQKPIKYHPSEYVWRDI